MAFLAMTLTYLHGGLVVTMDYGDAHLGRSLF